MNRPLSLPPCLSLAARLARKGRDAPPPAGPAPKVAPSGLNTGTPSSAKQGLQRTGGEARGELSSERSSGFPARGRSQRLRGQGGGLSC